MYPLVFTMRGLSSGSGGPVCKTVKSCMHVHSQPIVADVLIFQVFYLEA